MESPDFDRILDCAAEAFALHGFAGTGMRELSEQCGVSVPTIYYYFSSKEKLFEAVCQRRYRAAIELINKALDTKTGLADRIEQLCGKLFDLLTTDRTLFLLLRRDLIDGSIPGAGLHSQTQYEALVDIFRSLFGEHRSAAEAGRLAFTASALIFGYCEFVYVVIAKSGSTESLLQHRRDLIRALRALSEEQPAAARGPKPARAKRRS